MEKYFAKFLNAKFFSTTLFSRENFPSPVLANKLTLWSHTPPHFLGEMQQMHNNAENAHNFKKGFKIKISGLKFIICGLNIHFFTKVCEIRPKHVNSFFCWVLTLLGCINFGALSSDQWQGIRKILRPDRHFPDFFCTFPHFYGSIQPHPCGNFVN